MSDFIPVCDRPIVFLDCETSHLDPRIGEMLEFAAINGTTGETLTFKLIPRRIEAAHPKALEVNGFDAAEWALTAIPLSEAAPRMAAFLRGAVLVGHNVRFDMGFVEATLAEAGIVERFDHHLIDTCAIAYFLLGHELASLSLKPVCVALGIEPEPDMHRAMAGARACKAVYEALQAMRAPVADRHCQAVIRR